MLFVRPTRLGREKELKVFKYLEKVQFHNPFPEEEQNSLPESDSDRVECTQPGDNNSVIHGTKVDGVWQGPFTEIYPDGSFRKGTYVNGRIDGKLSYTDESGNRLDCEWNNNNYNGPWTYYCYGKGVLRGVWENGKNQVGDATYTYDDGSEYVGSVKNYLCDGKGTLTLPNKTVLKGFFIEDEINGPVEIRFPNGDLYIGEWSGGITGKGEFYSECCPGIRKLYFRGFWRNGKPNSNDNAQQSRLNMQITTDKEYSFFGEFKNGNAYGNGLLQCRRIGESAEPIASGVFTDNVLTSGEKSRMVRTIEAYIEAATTHIRQTVISGLRGKL